MKISIAAFVVFICAATETAGVVNDTRFCSGKRTGVYEGVCYMEDYVNSHMQDTKIFCDSRQSTILTIKSARQLKSVQTFLPGEGRYWLDLHRRTGGWYWGDGTPFFPTVLQWSKGLERIHTYATFALTTQGTLIPILSRDMVPNGYICEVKPTDKTCPTHFKLSGDACFYLSSLSNIRTMAYYSADASRKCEEVARGAKLLEIRSKEKMRAVKKLIKRFKSPYVWYIGLNKNGDRWTWKSDSSDASSVKNATYIKWANENDNLGGEENCAVVFPHMGRIRDVQCGQLGSGSVCMKPTTLPAVIPPTFRWPYRGWMRGSTSCYMVLEKLQTWSNARAYCQKFGGDLAKIPLLSKARWIRHFMWRGAAWTGLCHENGAWRWRDSQLLDNKAVKWNAEPNTIPGGSCAVINVRGEFVAKSCYNHYRYVCEMPVKDGAKCPDHWSYFNQSCYVLIPNDRATWPDANRLCQELADTGHYSYVFYPRYVGEIDHVLKTFLPKIVRSKEEGNSPLYIWTLLTDGKYGAWEYSYDWHQKIKKRQLNWRKSPSKEATTANSKYCAVFDGGSLVDHPKSATFKSVCQRPLGDGCGEMKQPYY